jgi:hypothetical protein
MTNIRYLVWKKDNSLIITENIDEILGIDKSEIKCITKESIKDRTYISELYFNKSNKTPEDIIEKYDNRYLQKMESLEPYHLNDKDKEIIYFFNSNKN